MEDDKLKSLFAGFDPELSPDRLFMDKLKRNMESVEIVKRGLSEARARSRRAVTIAAVVGFIVGFLSSLALPYLTDIVSDWQMTLAPESAMSIVADNFPIIAWAMIGAMAVLAAINTYDALTTAHIHTDQSNGHSFDI